MVAITALETSIEKDVERIWVKEKLAFLDQVECDLLNLAIRNPSKTKVSQCPSAVQAVQALCAALQSAKAVIKILSYRYHPPSKGEIDL